MKIPTPRKLKSGNYFIQLRLNGVSVPITAASATECRRRAELIKAQHLAKASVISKGSDMIIGDAIDEYISNNSNTLSPSTLRGYSIMRRNRFRSVIDKPFSRVKNWQRIINDEAATCSAKTLKNAWGLISAVMRSNDIPVPHIKLPQVVKKDALWLEPEQITVFVEAVSKEPFAVSALLALHSLRRSEIYAIAHNGGIDLKKNVIHVRGAVVPNEQHQMVYKETNKTNSSSRDIPIMIPQLIDAIKSGLPIVEGSPDTLRRRINRVCRENDLPEVGIHGLRHSFASLAYHLGWSEQFTMEIGGWSDTKTMHNIYTHLSRSDRFKANSAMFDFYSK